MYKFRDSSKSLTYNLKSIYGIGSSRAREIAGLIGTAGRTELSKIPRQKLEVLQQIISYYSNLNDCRSILQNLHRFHKNNVGRLIKMNSYRGRRHRMRLPVRGQRTKCNAKTIRRALKY